MPAGDSGEACGSGNVGPVYRVDSARFRVPTKIADKSGWTVAAWYSVCGNCWQHTWSDPMQLADGVDSRGGATRSRANSWFQVHLGGFFLKKGSFLSTHGNFFRPPPHCLQIDLGSRITVFGMEVVMSDEFPCYSTSIEVSQSSSFALIESKVRHCRYRSVRDPSQW